MEAMDDDEMAQDHDDGAATVDDLAGACQSAGDYPLYCSSDAAAAASPTGEIHAMGAFYMPNGVATYHGDYVGAAEACACEDAAAADDDGGGAAIGVTVATAVVLENVAAADFGDAEEAAFKAAVVESVDGVDDASQVTNVVATAAAAGGTRRRGLDDATATTVSFDLVFDGGDAAVADAALEGLEAAVAEETLAAALAGSASPVLAAATVEKAASLAAVEASVTTLSTAAPSTARPAAVPSASPTPSSDDKKADGLADAASSILAFYAVAALVGLVLLVAIAYFVVHAAVEEAHPSRVKEPAFDAEAPGADVEMSKAVAVRGYTSL